MDGLMIDTQRVATRSWKRAARVFGFTLTDEINFKLIGRNVLDSNSILTKELGNEFPVNDCRNLMMKIYSEDISKNGISLKPGLLNLLSYFKEYSIDYALATSTSRELTLQRLEMTKLINRFQIIVTGDDVVNGKPDPDIYLKASLLLKTPPSSCIVLEDSFAGIRGAYNAEMIPIMVPDLLEPSDEVRSLAHAVVPSLVEAKAEIEKLFQRHSVIKGKNEKD